MLSRSAIDTLATGLISRLIGCVGVLVFGLATKSQAAEGCDRACLEGFVNQYLDALVSSDPSKLPLAQNARYTENGQELKLGDGMLGPTVTQDQ